MKQVTLQTIIGECLNNPSFFESLIKDPEKALAGKEWILNASELAELKEHLQNPRVEINVVDFFREFTVGPDNPTWKIIPVWWGGKKSK